MTQRKREWGGDTFLSGTMDWGQGYRSKGKQKEEEDGKAGVIVARPYKY